MAKTRTLRNPRVMVADTNNRDPGGSYTPTMARLLAVLDMPGEPLAEVELTLPQAMELLGELTNVVLVLTRFAEIARKRNGLGKS